VQYSGFVVEGLGFGVQGSVVRVRYSGFRVQGSGFSIQGSEFRVNNDISSLLPAPHPIVHL